MDNPTSPTDPHPAPRQCPECGAALPSDETGGLCPKCLMADALDGKGGDPVCTPAPPWPTPTLGEVARLFPRLEILECLGRGGMGAVYKARQSDLDRTVALKILPRESAGDPAFADRFRGEARALARLSHPNIVGIHEFGEVDGTFFFLMEYVDGASLRHLLRGGPLDPSEALALVPDLCDALQYAHDEGVVHRDIKPENVLVDVRGRVKIADFGLARLLEPLAPVASPVLTRTHEVMGTPHYMAPEQIAGGRGIDRRADIYALGVVLYEMLTGSLPRGRFDPPSRQVSIDVRIDEIVLRALEHDRERRYQQASEVKFAVQGIASPLSAEPRSSSLPSAGGTRGRGRNAIPAWWLRTGAVAQRAARAALWVALAAAAILLVSSQGSGGPGRFRLEVGAPWPWLTIRADDQGHAFSFAMLLFVALAMALVLAAISLRRLPRLRRAACWGCGADLPGVGAAGGSPTDSGDRCPECGRPVAAAARQPESSHRLAAVAAALVVAVALAGSAGFLMGRDPLLARAVAAGEVGAASRWIDLGADPDSVNRAGQPLLVVAAGRRDEAMTRLLVSRSANLNSGAPLAWAAALGADAIVRALLEAGAEADHPLDRGVTPLMLASALGHPSCVDLLLAFGADVGARDDGITTDIHLRLGNSLAFRWPGRKLTPLMLAAGAGHAEIVESLVRHGADPDTEDADGRTAADHARAGGHEQIATLLAGIRAPRPDAPAAEGSSVIAAAAEGRIGRVRALVAAGTDVNDKGTDGTTALIEAARGGHVSTVVSLILLGANSADSDDAGITPLMAAAEADTDHAALAQALVDLETTLAVVRRQVAELPPGTPEREDAAKALLGERLPGVDLGVLEQVGTRLPEFEIDIKLRDRNGETAVMKAAAQGHVGFVRALHVRDEADARDAQGRNAAMHAVRNGRTDFVRALLDHPNSGLGTSAGSFPSHSHFSPQALAATDRDDRTAIDLAVALGHHELAGLLRDEARRAVDHFTRAIEAGGRWTSIYFRNRSWARAALGDTEGAAADLREAARRNPVESMHNGWLDPPDEPNPSE